MEGRMEYGGREGWMDGWTGYSLKRNDRMIVMCLLEGMQQFYITPLWLAHPSALRKENVFEFSQSLFYCPKNHTHTHTLSAHNAYPLNTPRTRFRTKKDPKMTRLTKIDPRKLITHGILHLRWGGGQLEKRKKSGAERKDSQRKRVQWTAHAGPSETQTSRKPMKHRAYSIERKDRERERDVSWVCLTALKMSSGKPSITLSIWRSAEDWHTEKMGFREQQWSHTQGSMGFFLVSESGQ